MKLQINVPLSGVVFITEWCYNTAIWNEPFRFFHSPVNGRKFPIQTGQYNIKIVLTLWRLKPLYFYIKTQSVPRRKHFFSVIKPASWYSEMYTEVIAVCSQIHIKHIHTFHGRNVELLNVKPWWYIQGVPVGMCQTSAEYSLR